MPNPPKPIVPNISTGVATGRVATDRYDFQAHVDGTDFRQKANTIDLFPTVIISTEVTNVQDAIVQLKNALTVPILPDATATVKGAIKLTGDLGGNADFPSVVALRGFPVAATPPTTNYVLTWGGSSWGPSPVGGSFTLGGDVTGPVGSNTVSNIVGRPISNASPAANDAFIWTGAAWTPTRVIPTGTGLVSSTSGVIDATATPNIRYTGGKLQTDVNLQFKNGAILGDLSWSPTSSNKTLTLPNATDTIVGRDTADTLTSKTINATNNTITDTGTLTGDILVSNGTKFVRRAQGSNGTFWGVSGGVAGYYTPPTGSIGVSGTGFVTVTSSVVDASATSNIRYIGGKFQTDLPIQFQASGITGDLVWTPTSTNKTLTLPNTTDTLVGQSTSDTLTNKTINASNNTISDSGTASGDLFKSNGTKFVNFAKGNASQVMHVKSDGTDLEYIDPSLEHRISRAFPSDANYTAISTDYRASIMEFTGAITATRDVIVPIISGYKWIIFNGTSGGQSIRIIGATGTGITIANGMRATVYADGTNIVRATADV